MDKRKFQAVWFIAIILGVTLACQTLSGVGQDFDKAKGTIQSLGTQANKISTQFGGFATSIEKSGALKTAGAIATSQGSKLVGTLGALATEAEQRGIQGTVEAFINKEGSQALGTVAALATQGISEGKAPEDIPVLPQDQIGSFFGSDVVVTYSAQLSYAQVLDFYKTHMPVNGWTAVVDGSVERESSAVLKFDKPDREATVLLTFNSVDQTTLIAIMIRTK